MSTSSSHPKALCTTDNMQASSALGRFPDHWHLIVQKCRECEDFRELCSHYAECQSALNRARQIPIPDARQIREYQELIDDLEQEIFELIGDP